MEWVASIVVGVLSLVGVVISSTIQGSKTTSVMQSEIKGSNALFDQKITEVRKDVSDLAERVNKHNTLVERMAIVEQSTKSAHKRLDDAGIGCAPKK